jgi:hypothetical protein
LRLASWALALAVLGTPSLAAQQAIVQGFVQTDVGRPVARAEVRIEGTRLLAMTDSAGRYRLAAVPAGPQVVLVRRLGFAPARIPVTVPTSGTLTVDAALAASALNLPDIIVTADPGGRATGELATASVIDREAIAAQNAVDIRGVLELLPGVPLTPPGLDAPRQFALRNVPASSTTQLTQGEPGADDIAAFGTQIVQDGVPLSNNANLQTTGPRGEIRVASTAGGGVDLRMIPAATLDRVEAIRGIPSARFGDLTQGVILVETRAGAVPPTLTARYDPRTFSLNGIAGRAFGGSNVLTANLDVTETRTAPGLRDDLTRRLAGQLSHRWTPGSWTFDTRVDAFRVLQNSPERPEVVQGLASRNDDRGLRVSQRTRRPLGNSTTFEATASVDHVRRDSHTQAMLIRSALPFTDRLDAGTSVGKFIGGQYLSAVDLDGREWHLYGRLELDHRFDAAGMSHRSRGGIELRREWNGGPGYQFDIEFPPQVTFNGVQGFDRPRRFDAVPPVASTALYLDQRARAALAGMALDLQAGLRLDVLHRGTSWFSGARDQVLQPRLQAELAPVGWFRLRAGWGRTAKLPPLSSLYPAPQYFDVVNVNWFTTDPAARLAVLTTFVQDPTNPDLGFAVGTKSEAGFEIATSRRGASLAVTFYRDRTRGSAGLNPVPGFLTRDLYDFSDSSFTGQPPTLIQPPTRADTVPILVDHPANNLRLLSEGVEVSLGLPQVRPLNLKLDVAAAWAKTELARDGLDFGRVFGESFQMNANRVRSPYWESPVRTGDRLILTYRLIHHQPKLGLILTATVQHTARERRRNIGGNDTLAFAGYITRAGELVPVPPERRGDPEFADLRVARIGFFNDPEATQPDWMLSLNLAKTLPLGGRLSFFAFNALDRQGRLASPGFQGRAYAPLRYGLTVTMPLGGVP